MSNRWYINFIQKTLVLYTAGIALGFFWRLAFWAIFYQKNDPALWRAFFLGSRFDLTVLCYVQSIPLLLLMLASIVHIVGLESFIRIFTQRFHKFLRAYWAIFGFIIFWLSASDLGFYSYYQDRLNMMFFGFLEDDTVAIMKTMWKNYPMFWFLCGVALYVYLQDLFFKRIWSQEISFAFPQKSPFLNLKTMLILVPLFLVNGVGARGSLALFPLSEMDTHISKAHFVNLLSWNPLHSFAKAIENRIEQKSKWDSNLEFFGYSGRVNQAFVDYFKIPETQLPSEPLSLMNRVTPKNEWAQKTKPHVVLIVLESFGANWAKYNQGDFNLLGSLKKHFQEDYYSPHLISATSGTIGSVSSLMVGTPQRNISEFLTESPYMTTPFESSPALTYKKAGYETHFIYGGNPGWRNINTFARKQGFDFIEGDADIEAALGGNLENHDWGVFDHDLFRYLHSELEKATTPRFYMVLTTSNHPPYQLPSGYQTPPVTIPQDLIPNIIGSLEVAKQRFDVFTYASNSFGQFMTNLKASPLSQKTIVAATGDHSFWLIQFPESHLMKKFAVPFYLYSPAANKLRLTKESFSKTYGAHADIIPTLFEASLSQAPYVSLSQSFFSPTRFNVADGYSRLVAGPEGLISVGKTDAENIYYQWKTAEEELEPGKINETYLKFAAHHRSQQAILDLYYKNQKERNSHSK